MDTLYKCYFVTVFFQLAYSQVFDTELLARSTVAKSRANNVNYRLPSSIIPLKYDITLEPNFNTDTFSGMSSIEINAVEEANTITLHAYQLTINESLIEVLDANGNSTKVTGVTESDIADQQFYIINLESALQPNQNYTLVFGGFTGILNNDLDGFYLAKYNDVNGNERKLAITQFEPTGARRAFPCFDEPHLKATFQLRLVRPINYTSEANTPLEISARIAEDKFLDEFQETLPMSSYLVAFIISDLNYTKKLHRQRILARPKEIEDGRADFPLDQANQVLRALENFTGIAFALPKMDEVAVPEGYFSAGAMENWGLVTYRELSLLYYNESTTETRLESITSIISHEYGHQWFGDLVSPLWWKYIWLNEGFATYFEFYITGVVHEDWEMMDQFVIRNVHSAMSSDQTLSTRIMNQDAGSPSEISSLFDVIAYNKAGAVIRTMETFLSTPVFKSGLNKYLTKKRYSAAQPSDLYSALQEAADEAGLNLNVSKIMTTWDSTPGVPLVTVTRNYDSGSVTFTQNRFIATNPNYTSDELWYIPITYSTKSKADFNDLTTDIWLTTATASENLGLSASDWLLVNKKQRGYYRVNYDESNWKLIIDYLNRDNFENIPITNRAQLIDDALTLARSGRVNYRTVFELLNYLSRETHYVPLYALFNNFDYLRRLVQHSTISQMFQDHFVTLLENVYNKLKVEESANDSHCDKRNRPNVINSICLLGSAACRNDTLTLLRRWRSTGTNLLPVTAEQQILCGALRNGFEDDWNFVYNQFLSSQDSTRRTRYIAALACSENPDLITRFLNQALNDGSPLAVYRARILTDVYSSGNVGLRTLLDYIKSNLTQIAEARISVSALLAAVANYLNTEEQIKELQDLKTAYPAYGTAIDNAISRVESNVRTANLYLPAIESFYIGSDSSSALITSGRPQAFICIAISFILAMLAL
ncbi:aminopeptidase N-like isoform X2 [Agrilus planipennis]|nr:aminopeptidase N-like isoform X2 [Agrilus planipennis]